MIAPGPAVLAALVLFLAPGLLFLAYLPARERARLPADEALFLTVAISTACAAWVALLLAEWGHFHVLVAAGLVAGVTGLLALRLRRRLGWPLRFDSWRRWPPVLALLLLASLLQARPSEYLFGGRDPGTYVNAMALIGRTGGIVYTDPAVLALPREFVSLFYREPDKPGTFEWGRFMGFPLERPETGRVLPEFFHLFPAFGAYLFQTMGIKGALATPPVFGILATLAVYFALRRLIGSGPAWFAGLLLATNVLQVWFARFPVSELTSQFLTFLGLLALLRFEARRARAWGALAGAAFGLSLLVRIDSVLILLPLLAWVSIRAAEGRLPWPRLLALVVPFALLATHAALHASFFARKYVHSILTRPYWQQAPATWLVALLALAAASVVVWRFGPRLLVQLEARGRALRAVLAGLLVLMAVYAYAVRPALSAAAGADGNPAVVHFEVQPGSTRVWVDGREAGRADALSAGLSLPAGRHELTLVLDDRAAGTTAPRRVLSLGLPAGARLRVRETLTGQGDATQSTLVWERRPGAGLLAALGFRRLAAQDAQAFLRFGWFVSPLGLLLGLLGLLVVLRNWRPAWLFPLLLLLSCALFYFYKMRVWNDYYFAMRRVMPVTLPLSLACAAVALAWLARRPRFGRSTAALVGLLLLALFARDTRPLWTYTDWRGAVRFVQDLSRRFGPEDVVIFEQPRSIHLLALPLWAVEGDNVLELARFNPDPERLNALARAWRGRWRQIYFVHTYSTDLCGVFLQHVQDLEFGSAEWERPSDRAPRRAEFRALRFSISRLVPPEELQVPALPEVDVGGSDDFQVSGFFDKELARDPLGERTRSYRWTGRCASVYLPGAQPGASVTVTASRDRRPAELPATVRVSLSGVPLGSFEAATDWRDFTLQLPRPLPPGPPLLRFDTSDWRPAKLLPGSDDVRDLGIVVDRIRVGTTPTTGVR
jgi:hypothetical protein